MKTLAIAVAALLFGTLTSCNKDIYGCTDNTAVNYSELATKDDGSCFFPEMDITTSTQVTISNWSQAGNDWVTTIAYGEIDVAAIEEGAIITYLEDGMNIWKPLPLTIYSSTTYSTTIEVSITVGQVLVYWRNSDDTLPTNPGERVFKITVIR